MNLETLKTAILQLPEADCYTLATVCQQQGDALKDKRQKDVLRRQAEELESILDKQRRELLENGIQPTGKLAKAKKMKKPDAAKLSVYKSGTLYQHPENEKLQWNGHGKRPAWVIDAERQGVKLVEAKSVVKPSEGKRV